MHAVDRVTFAVDEREVVGLVGESGCGKSTLGKALLGLVPANAGTVSFGSAPVLMTGPATTVFEGEIDIPDDL